MNYNNDNNDFKDFIWVALLNPTPWEIIQKKEFYEQLGYYLADTEWASDEKYKILVTLKFELLKE